MSIKSEMVKSCEKLVTDFGAKRISELTQIPNFYTFKNRLFHSHRDLDLFLEALDNGEKCAILSGFNASGTIHIGHKIVFDTNLFFQREHGCDVFIPISDDESYVAGKVKTQQEGLENAMKLVKELIAYGFDPAKTYFIIDQVYTNIYNYAMKYSTGTTMKTIQSCFGFDQSRNPGLFFYPIIQTAHVLFPLDEFGYDRILVPIGPDEDVHLRLSRDIAPKFGLTKASVIHSVFLPGLTGEKMSTSKPDTAIFLSDTPKQIKKKANKSFSGGRSTIDEHRLLGGNCDNDIACIYLAALFFDETQARKVMNKFTEGDLLCGDVKKMFSDELMRFVSGFQHRLAKVTDKEIQPSILKNRS